LSDGGSDASGDAVADARDAAENTDSGICPPNNDPTLVAYYPFNEGSGTIAHDCSGNGFNALIEGSNVSWTSGHSGTAILFVSADNVCVVVSSSSANQSGAFTVSAWVNPNGSNGGYVVGQRQEVGYAWRIDIEPTDAGASLSLAVGTGDDAGDDDFAGTIIQPGSFHHVVGVFAPGGSTQTIYLDGVPNPSPSAAQMIVLDPMSSTIRVGCRGDDTNFFDGVIDEVRVYDRVLSESEIVALP